MNNYNQSNSKIGILEEMIYGKMVATKNKIVKEFIEKYIIIALIPWVIYRIGIYILCDIANKTMEKQQFSIE